MSRVVRALVLATLLLSACGQAPTTRGDGDSAGAPRAAAGLDAPPASRTEQARRDETATAGRALASPERVAGFGQGVGFRSRQRLAEHFEKHGHEFGVASATDYLRQAQGLRDAPVGGAILEIRRADGSYSRFDRSTGAFLAYDADGTIRTYFRPNDGEAYFRRQGRRRVSP